MRLTPTQMQFSPFPLLTFFFFMRLLSVFFPKQISDLPYSIIMLIYIPAFGRINILSVCLAPNPRTTRHAPRTVEVKFLPCIFPVCTSSMGKVVVESVLIKPETILYRQTTYSEKIIQTDHLDTSFTLILPGQWKQYMAHFVVSTPCLHCTVYWVPQK